MTDATGREAIPQIAALINEIDICLFTTRGERGELHSRPMSNNGQVEWDGQSWFFAPADGRLVAELRADPAAVAAYRAEQGYTFVSVSGRATIETDEGSRSATGSTSSSAGSRTDRPIPNVTLIRLDAEHADWWTEDGDGSADLREAVVSS